MTAPKARSKENEPLRQRKEQDLASVRTETVNHQ